MSSAAAFGILIGAGVLVSIIINENSLATAKAVPSIGSLVSEVCYDGVIYIVTDKGSITPKIRDQIANTPYYGCELTK